MKAISMSVQQILRSKEIIVVVPDTRKARAVKQRLEGTISPMMPASILRKHPNAQDLPRCGLRGAPKFGSFYHPAIIRRRPLWLFAPLIECMPRPGSRY